MSTTKYFTLSCIYIFVRILSIYGIIVIVWGDIMGIGVYFSISSCFIITILTYIFFSKRRVENVETKTYGKMLFLTLFGLFLEVATCIWFVLGASLDSIAYQFISKLTSSYYMLWSGLFVNYLISICNVNKKI